MKPSKKQIAIDIRFISVNPKFTSTPDKYITLKEINELREEAPEDIKEQGVSFIRIEEDVLTIVLRGFKDHTQFLGRSALLMFSFIFGEERRPFCIVPVELSRLVGGDKVVGCLTNLNAVTSSSGYSELHAALKAANSGDYEKFKNTMIGKIIDETIEETTTDKMTYQKAFGRLHLQIKNTNLSANFMDGCSVFDERCTVIAHPQSKVGFDIAATVLQSSSKALVPENPAYEGLYKNLKDTELFYYRGIAHSEDKLEHAENKRKFKTAMRSLLHSCESSCSLLLTAQWQIQAAREVYSAVYDQGVFDGKQAPSVMMAISIAKK